LCKKRKEFIIKQKILYWIIKILPKLNWCVIRPYPDYEDNAVAVYQKLIDKKVTKIIWVRNKNCHPPFQCDNNTIFVKQKSWKDMFYCIFSKYIFITHGHFLNQIPPNQICVNLWHGMPIKGIGLLNNMSGRQDTFLLSTSPLFQDIMSRSLGMPLDKTLTIGLPRNDLFISENCSEIWDRAGIDREQYKKVFFWLPTYRQSVVGDIRKDGVECDNVFNIPNFPQKEFNDFLIENKCLCILKPHPMAPVKDAHSTDNILIIDEGWLWSRGLTLYPLVGQTDFLVSDISSILIDYILLNKPMIVCFSDMDEYANSRSVMFDPLEDWLPADITHDYDELILSLERILKEEDISYSKRKRLLTHFHTHVDFKSTDKLMNIIFKES
jgi:CDP-glycerol glycerophosphotransferase (TagB/SpsB family)